MYYLLTTVSSSSSRAEGRKKVLIKLDIKFYKCHFSMLIWDLTKRVDTTISVKVISPSLYFLFPSEENLVVAILIRTKNTIYTTISIINYLSIRSVLLFYADLIELTSNFGPFRSDEISAEY